MKGLFKRIVHSFRWSDWKDLCTYHTGSRLAQMLVQVRENANGKKQFRTVRIAGLSNSVKESTGSLELVSVEELTKQNS
jgi:outer membrane receptor for Fe3+-dicitrate